MKCPLDENETLFLSQLPYVPLGDLRAVVSYPCNGRHLSDGDTRETLSKVALPHLIHRLNEVQDWAKVLSPGEQQRVAFARVLLSRPRAVFLDESTSALDEGLEMMLYQLVRRELPDTIVVSVSHRSTVEQHHEQEAASAGRRWLAAHADHRRRRRAGTGVGRLPGRRPGSGPPAKERAFAQLGAAGVTLAVLGNVGRASAGRIQTWHHAAVLAQHLAVQ